MCKRVSELTSEQVSEWLQIVSEQVKESVGFKQCC